VAFVVELGLENLSAHIWPNDGDIVDLQAVVASKRANSGSTINTRLSRNALYPQTRLIVVRMFVAESACQFGDESFADPNPT